MVTIRFLYNMIPSWHCSPSTINIVSTNKIVAKSQPINQTDINVSTNKFWPKTNQIDQTINFRPKSYIRIINIKQYQTIKTDTEYHIDIKSWPKYITIKNGHNILI